MINEDGIRCKPNMRLELSCHFCVYQMLVRQPNQSADYTYMQSHLDLYCDMANAINICLPRSVFLALIFHYRARNGTV